MAQEKTMNAAETLVDGPDLRLCPSPAQPSQQALAQSLPPASESPSHGRWLLHGFECQMTRRRDGRVGCYVRIPHTHELYGRTDLNELSLALSCLGGISYSSGGEHGWFIGSVISGSWEDAWDLLDDLAKQLTQFTPSDVEEEPNANRASGVHLRLV
jgi:hypothetical protein